MHPISLLNDPALLNRLAGIAGSLDTSLREAVSAANALSGNVVGLNLFRTRSRGGKPPSYGVTKDQWDEARSAAGIKREVPVDGPEFRSKIA